MPTYRKDPDAISRLSREQHRVTQQVATDLPGTGEYLYNKEALRPIHPDDMEADGYAANLDPVRGAHE